MNRLSLERRAQIIKALVDGASVRATCRMTGSAKGTVLRLLADIGETCLDLHDKHVRNVNADQIQMDEIWSYVHTKARNLAPEERGQGKGDAWTWVAMDSVSKLVVSWLVAPRSWEAARQIAGDLAARLATRCQISTDGLRMYPPAIEAAFGWGGADYGQIEKLYASNEGRSPDRRYSAATCIGVKKRWVMGRPEEAMVSTSIIERKNLTLRMSQRRFTRLTNGFSKKLENHAYAVALHFVHYNWCRPHGTLTKRANGVRTTPAMAAGLTNRVIKVEDLVGFLEGKELGDS